MKDTSSNDYSYIYAPFDGDHDNAVIPITEHIDKAFMDKQNPNDYRHNYYIPATEKVGAQAAERSMLPDDAKMFTSVFEVNYGKDFTNEYLQKALTIMKKNSTNYKLDHTQYNTMRLCKFLNFP